MKNRILLALAAAILAACGGANTSSTDSSQKAQAKATLSIKQTASNYQTAVEALYVAYFGRPADPNGLNNFEAALQAAGAPADVPGLALAYSSNVAVKTLIDSFGTSAESQTLYGSGNTAAFVTAVFQNVLGRTPQSSGLTFWVNSIDSGQTSMGDAALAIMAGAFNNSTDQGKLDQRLINNRLAVAGNFTAQVSTFNAVSNYNGASAAASARSMLADVTATTDVNGFQATTSATVAALISTAPILEQYVGATGGTGNVNGPIATARFANPTAVVMDSKGNLFVLDNPVIRKVSADGIVTTFAGNAAQSGSTDGTGTAASFYAPYLIAIDANDNLYVSDQYTIRKITPGGVVTTYAGKSGVLGHQNGTLANATFGYINGMTFDGAGDLLVADNNDQTLRKIDASGNVTVLTGISGVSGSADGPAGTATFNRLGVMTADHAGNIYMYDEGNDIVRKITPAGVVTTMAGLAGSYGDQDGQGGLASFDTGTGIAVDASGSVYLVSGFINNNTIRKVDASGNVTHFTGRDSFICGYADGTTDVALFCELEGIWFDAQYNLYLADSGNAVIRKITPALNVSTIAGLPNYQSDVDGTGANARFASSRGIAFGPSGNMYVTDEAPAVRKVAPGRIVSTLAGSNGVFGSTDGVGSAASFEAPTAVAVDSSENVYVVDELAYTIRKITPNGAVTTIAGQAGHYGYQDSYVGPTWFAYPDGIVIDSKGTIYIADSGNGLIRTISTQGLVGTYIGKRNAWPIVDGPPDVATFFDPGAMAIDSADNLYVYDDFTIRKIDPSGNVTTLAGIQGTPGYQDGPGKSALFGYPTGLAVDTQGNVYVADSNNWLIRKITPTGMVSTILGQEGVMGFVAGAAPGAILAPRSLAIQGNVLYVTADSGVLAVYNLLLQ